MTEFSKACSIMGTRLSVFKYVCEILHFERVLIYVSILSDLRSPAMKKTPPSLSLFAQHVAYVLDPFPTDCILTSQTHCGRCNTGPTWLPPKSLKQTSILLPHFLIHGISHEWFIVQLDA